MHYSSQGREAGLQSDPDGVRKHPGHCYYLASLKAVGSLSAVQQNGLMSSLSVFPDPMWASSLTVILTDPTVSVTVEFGSSFSQENMSTFRQGM